MFLDIIIISLHMRLPHHPVHFLCIKFHRKKFVAYYNNYILTYTSAVPHSVMALDYCSSSQYVNGKEVTDFVYLLG